MLVQESVSAEGETALVAATLGGHISIVQVRQNISFHNVFQYARTIYVMVL